jgi:hypothetical protein
MYWQPFFIASNGVLIDSEGDIMGKLKESLIVASEHNELVIDETIDYQRIIDALIEGATAFRMLSNHCPVDEKHYFVDKQDELMNCAAVMRSFV